MIIKTLSYAALAERLKCTLEAARSLVTGEVATLKERIESLQAEPGQTRSDRSPSPGRLRTRARSG